MVRFFEVVVYILYMVLISKFVHLCTWCAYDYSKEGIAVHYVSTSCVIYQDQ